jgi:hypothetical protein
MGGAPEDTTGTASSSGRPLRNHRGGRAQQARNHSTFSPYASSAAITAVAATCAPTMVGPANTER